MARRKPIDDPRETCCAGDPPPLVDQQILAAAREAADNDTEHSRELHAVTVDAVRALAWKRYATAFAMTAAGTAFTAIAIQLTNLVGYLTGAP